MWLVFSTLRLSHSLLPPLKVVAPSNLNFEKQFLIKSATIFTYHALSTSLVFFMRFLSVVNYLPLPSGYSWFVYIDLTYIYICLTMLYAHAYFNAISPTPFYTEYLEAEMQGILSEYIDIWMLYNSDQGPTFQPFSTRALRNRLLSK